MDLHPIVQQLDPSPEQKDPIRSRGKDIVVTAGAGTGKTRTLVARFLGLIADGMPLRSVVAITFTKKAAREMRNRIREEVRKYLLADSLSEEERATWRQIYESLDAARISTIHSLAGDILKQHPAEMGLDPDFKMLDEAEAARLKELAVEAALSWAGGDDLASELFTVFGDWKLRRILGELLSKRLDVWEALNRTPDDLWSSWKTYLIAPLRSFVEDPTVRSGLDELSGLKYDGTIQRAHEAGDLLVDDLRIVINEWEIIQEAILKEDWIRISRSVGTLGCHLKQKGKGENWAPANPRGVIKEVQALFNEYIGKTEFDLDVDRKLATEITPALRAAFLYAANWYEEARDQVNGLDFDDLEEKVLYLLNNYPDVLSYWQGEVLSLLVDEYQDTNTRQRELVNLLNGGKGHLFIVGDGKQSIYRFRGADVAVFREEKERIGREGEIYHLDTSYRSHMELLENQNALLAPVLGDQTDIPYLEPFARLKPGRKGRPKAELSAYVEFHLAAGSKSEGADARAAEAVASRLLELIKQDPGNSAERQFNYGDMAVLCRAASSFSAFEQAFEKAGIPYTTIAGQGFYERPEVRDVLNALKVFVDPQNDLALAGFLRSPVSGFSDEFLLDLREFQRTEKLGSLLEAAHVYESNLTGEIQERLAAFVRIVEVLSNLAGRVTAAELISKFLERTAYAAVLTLGGQERAAGNLRKLVADAQESGLVNLADFLNSIDVIRNTAIREGEAQFVSEGAVQIMTVHQAKGLEFPIVILGDASKRARLSRDILLDDRFGMILPFSAKRMEEDSQGNPVIISGRSLAYELALDSERLKEEAETNRLLYVAATRAKDLLIISGVMGKPTRDNKIPGLSGWLASLTEDLGLDDLDLVIDREGSVCHRLRIEESNLCAEVAIYENSVEFDFAHMIMTETKDTESVIFDPALWSQQGIELDTLDPVDIVKEPIYPASKIGRTTHVPARIVGEVVHRALERWLFPENGETDFVNWAEAEFQKAGVYEIKAIRSGYKRVLKILERFTATDLYQRMEQSVITLHEVPYCHVDGTGSVAAGSIDALYKENDRWILVEFKTDEIRQGDEIDWGSVDYQQQVAGYLEAAETLLKQRPDPILCFLDYGGRVKLVTDRW